MDDDRLLTHGRLVERRVGIVYLRWEKVMVHVSSDPSSSESSVAS
jgi:hypothetical protein